MDSKKINIFIFLYNPFVKIAGLPALVFGALFCITGAMLAGIFNARFDGVVDLHFYQKVQFSEPLIDQVVIWCSMLLVFYPLSLLLGAKPRFIDIAGTFALSRFPYALAPLLNAGGSFTRLSNQLSTIDPEHFKLPFVGLEFTLFIIQILLSVVLLIWLIALYFNAYKICTNLKGNKLVVSFIIGLIVAETLSFFVIHRII